MTNGREVYLFLTGFCESLALVLFYLIADETG